MVSLKCVLLLLLYGCSGHDVVEEALSSSPSTTTDHDAAKRRTRDAARRLMEVSLRAAAAAEGGDASSSRSNGALFSDLRLVLKGLFEDDGEEMVLETMLTETWNKFVQEEQQQRSTNVHHEEETDCLDESYYADRHLANILETFNDYDCLEREFDVRTDPSSFDTDAAREVFEKCHLVVLRNVFSKEEIQELHSRFSKYIGEVYTGKIKAKTGTATTFGGDSFVLHESHKRWNILPPRDLVTRNIFANPVILEILSASSILGEDDLTVNHIGNINAEAGSHAQGWHADGAYIHGEDSLQVSGIAGHDLPPYAVNMFTPLLDMTSDLGPTEFCLGTSNLRGLAGSFYHVLDDRLFENGTVETLHNFEQRGGPCPAGFNRIPLLNMGDVVLVDYMVSHRGGSNKSSHLRSLLFVTYARKWYHDSNFDISYGENGEDEDDDWLTKWTRFALVEKIHEDNSCPNHDDENAATACKNDETTTAPPPLESISDFLQAYDASHY